MNGQLKNAVATTIQTKNGITEIVYHQTPVVKFDAKSITLNTGGYRTATTKRRMNQAAKMFDLGYSVVQKDFVWYVVNPGWDWCFGLPFTASTIKFRRQIKGGN